MSATATLPAITRPPLSAGSAQRLCWRQEWTRHRYLWANGLAVWVFLFLIPGGTTAPPAVLACSALWTGVLAMAVCGYDLRHGIDPLVRGLALDAGRRWLMRLLIVIAGSWAFYTAGLFACQMELAHRLWQPLANGPFSDSPAALTPTVLDGFAALALLALMSAAGAIGNARQHGSLWGLAFGTVVVVISLLAANGDGIVRAWPGHPAPTALSVTLWVGGVAAVAFAGLTAAGWRMEERRPPLLTAPGRSGGPFVVAGVFMAVVVLELFHAFYRWEGVPSWLRFAASLWHWLLLGQAVLFGLWIAREHRLGWPSPLVRSDARRGALTALVPLTHLVALLVVALPGPRPGGRPVSTDTPVHASQSWAEAVSRAREGGGQISGFDAVLYLATEGNPATLFHVAHTPVPLGQWVPIMAASQQILRVRVEPLPYNRMRVEVDSGEEREGRVIEPGPLWLRLHTVRVGGASPRWSAVLIPRFGADSARLRPFTSVMPDASARPWLLMRRYELREPTSTSSGMAGLLNAGSLLPGMAVCVAFLACLVLRNSRLPGVWLVGGLLLVLGALIGTDAARLHMQRRQGAPVAPGSAGGEPLAWHSYFQRPR